MILHKAPPWRYKGEARDDGNGDEARIDHDTWEPQEKTMKVIERRKGVRGIEYPTGRGS